MEEEEGKIQNYYGSFKWNVKLCFQHRVHWWDGLKKEGNLIDEEISVVEENSAKEKDAEIFIYSSLETALASIGQIVNGRKIIGVHVVKVEPCQAEEEETSLFSLQDKEDASRDEEDVVLNLANEDDPKEDAGIFGLKNADKETEIPHENETPAAAMKTEEPKPAVEVGEVKIAETVKEVKKVETKRHGGVWCLTQNVEAEPSAQKEQSVHRQEQSVHGEVQSDGHGRDQTQAHGLGTPRSPQCSSHDRHLNVDSTAEHETSHEQSSHGRLHNAQHIGQNSGQNGLQADHGKHRLGLPQTTENTLGHGGKNRSQANNNIE